MKVKNIIISVVAGVLIVCMGAAAGLYYIFKDIQYYAAQALKPIEDKIGYRIAIGDIEWNLLRGLGVTLKNLQITHTATNTTLLESEKVYVLCKLLPLLKKEIVISSIIVEKPRLSLVRMKDGACLTPLPPQLSDTSTVATTIKEYRFAITLKKIFIYDGSLQFRDEQYGVESYFKNLNLMLTKVPRADSFKISLSAKQKREKEAGFISFTGELHPGTGFVSSAVLNCTGEGVLTLQKLQPSPFMAYVKSWAGVSTVDGFIDAQLECSVRTPHTLTVRGSFASGAITCCSQARAPFTIPSGVFKINAAYDRNGIFFRNSELSLPGIVMKGDLLLTGINTDSFTIDARVHTNPFSWEQIRQHIPPQIVKDYLPEVLNKIVQGTMSLKNLHLNWKTNNAQGTSLEVLAGEGDIHHMLLSIRETLPHLKLVSGSFKLTGDSIHISNVRAQWFPEDSHELHGTITNPFKNPSLKLAISSTLPSASCKSLLSSLMQGNTQNTSADTAAAFSSGVIKATTDIQIPLSGSQSASFSSIIDLTNADYTIGQSIGKPLDLQNAIVVKGAFLSSELPKSLDVNVTLNNNDFLFSGIIKNWEAPVIEGSYQFNSLDLSSLRLPLLPPDVTIKALLQGKGTCQIPLLNPQAGVVKASLNANSFEIKKTSADSTLLAMNLQAAIQGKILTVTQSPANFGKTVLTVSGDLYGGEEPPRGNFNVDISYLDLDDFIETVIQLKKLFSAHEKLPAPSAGVNPPAPDTLAVPEHRPFFRRLIINSTGKVKDGKFMSWHFKDGTTFPSIKDGVLSFNNIKLFAYRGTITGAVVLDFSKPGIYTLTLLPSALGVEFEEFIPEIQEKKIVIGKIDLEGNFSSTYVKGPEFIPHMHGEFTVKMQDAKLGKFTVTSKILSLLNFSEMVKLNMPDLLSRGMPLDAVDGYFTMKSGVAHTDDLFMKSPGMNLSSVGDINFYKKEIDFIVGVQPLETIGQLLGSIPIAGSILTGENKSLTVSYFHVIGPYVNPSVAPMPVESISQGAKSVFKKILKLPQGIFGSPKKKENTDKQHVPGATK
ncbi:MAG: AsmA-like C-terminal domain-containing protein [Proteobacteria bacterium]|nr:AsmA-like C-terminal domain-containing protein [Pseudomonadota bacterium]